MPQYEFDVMRDDRVANTWDCAEVDGDSAALAYAEELLKTHPSAAHVHVFAGGRRVGEVSTRRTMGAGAPLRGCSVLVVEDQFLLAEDLRMLLRGAGAEVLGPFYDARSAIAAAKQWKPRCALVDINLGDGPDFEVAEAVLAEGAALIFVTGYEPDVVPKALSHVPHLRKPATRQDILATVEALCLEASLSC